MNDKKSCKCCKEEKLLSEFPIERDKRRRKPYLRGECKSCRNEKKRGYRRPGPGRWKKYKYDSNRRNIDFNLTLDQFLTFDNKPCGYCGIELDRIRLDRVNNNLGYFLENVVSCCFKCNSFKHTLEEKEFLKHITRVYLYQNNRKKNGEQKNSFKEASKEVVTNSEGIWASSGHSTRYYLGRTKEWGGGILSWLWKILSL